MDIPPELLAFVKEYGYSVDHAGRLVKAKASTFPEPVKVKKPEWSAVIDYAERLKSERMSSDHCDDNARDLKEYLYEQVMTTVYGPDYFSWANSLS